MAPTDRKRVDPNSNYGVDRAAKIAGREAKSGGLYTRFVEIGRVVLIQYGELSRPPPFPSPPLRPLPVAPTTAAGRSPSPSAACAAHVDAASLSLSPPPLTLPPSPVSVCLSPHPLRQARTPARLP